MEMLRSLGIDSTIIIQFFLSMIAYFVLSRLIFKPYFAAYQERYNRTAGSEDISNKINEETSVLESEYEENAKALNFKIKNIFNEEKKVAIKSQESILSDAYLKAEELKKNSMLKLEESKSKILSELEGEVKPLADLIKEKVLG